MKNHCLFNGKTSRVSAGALTAHLWCLEREAKQVPVSHMGLVAVHHDSNSEIQKYDSRHLRVVKMHHDILYFQKTCFFFLFLQRELSDFLTATFFLFLLSVVPFTHKKEKKNQCHCSYCKHFLTQPETQASF